MYCGTTATMQYNFSFMTEKRINLLKTTNNEVDL